MNAPSRIWITLGLLPTLLAGCGTPVAPAVPATQVAAAAAPLPSTPITKGVALVNPGFESTRPGARGDPEGWYSFQHAGDRSYRFVVDTAQPRSGERSLRIDNIGPEPYGAVAQIIEGAPHAGKIARLTAWMRTRNANDNGAVLTLLVLQSGATLAQNFMLDKPVKGTTEWTRYTITLPVTKGADRVEVGAMMRGKGSLWLDDVEVEFVTP
jgi:erythromycin esterase